MKTGIRLLNAALFAAIVTGSAHAAVSAEEAKQLGGPRLTVFGAEKAGNKEGTIPEYTGKGAPVSPDYDPKLPGTIPDPFNEKPLFSITAQNASQYANKLTEGQKAMFRKYPNFRMDVYPTHRTHVYPKYILENTLKNSADCRTANGGIKIESCWGGVPFPIPRTGNEVVWNHILRYVAPDYEGLQRTINVNGVTGVITNQGDAHTWEKMAFFDPKHTQQWMGNEPYYFLRFDNFGPARRAGEKTVIIDALDPVNPGRRAYSYIPGQRRVKLAPDLAYDTPSPVAAGSATIDESFIYFGAQDRYDFKLIGKRETYIFYNNFDISDYKKCPENVIATRSFLNPDCVRWELHRTWVVEGTLKQGFRHIYPKRTLYFDEDNPAVGTGDSYDASGAIYRVTNSITQPLVGDNGGSFAENSVTYDLQTGSYALLGIGGIKGNGWWPSPKPLDAIRFSPEAMAADGIR